jgi:hypothetical protein
VTEDRPDRLALALDVDRHAEPIEGTLRDASGAERPFRGWIGLASALEHALAAVEADPEPGKESS